MGGDLTSRIHGGPDGRGRCGAREVRAGRPRRDRRRAAAAAWTNIGPYRSNWIQNGLQVQESDTGRDPHVPRAPHEPGHALRADVERRVVENDELQRAAAGLARDDRHDPQHVGRQRRVRPNPETIYLGTGDPFDPGVGGFARRSTDGGETWSDAIKLGASTVIPDVKVDTSAAADIVLAGTNAGLFRSTDGGVTYSAAPVLAADLEPAPAPAPGGLRRGPSVPTDRSCCRPTRVRRGYPFRMAAT